ncbi:MAG: hypothetical protein H6Q73_523 [Firmicutes bacterium]|nr:hypothetical protein [Bacillota bacterium]
MRKLLPAVALAMVHIAGDNLGIVPDFAVYYGKDMYWIIVVAYIVLGSLVAGVAAWVGSRSGIEIGVLVRRMFGCRGKRLLAIAILAVSVPASAVTGGYYAGLVLARLSGIPYLWAAIICLGVVSVLASGRWQEFLRVANYGSFLMVPGVLLLAVIVSDYSLTSVAKPVLSDWQLVLALFSYNAGGMRPAVVAEAAGYLALKGYKPVVFAVVAKVVEGIFTIVIVYLALNVPVQGPLVLAQIATFNFGCGAFVFELVLLCVFIMAMTPAMLVNARQIGILTGAGFSTSLYIAVFFVYLASLAQLQVILVFMGISGLFMVGYLGYIAYHLHKLNLKKL